MGLLFQAVGASCSLLVVNYHEFYSYEVGLGL